VVDTTDIAQAAVLMGDPARANMLCALRDEGTLTASELSCVAGVAPNTASGHLARLSDAGLVVFETAGRRRLYRLKNATVADIIEALEALAGEISPHKRTSERLDPAIRFARTCYDHLAGTLGVRLAKASVSCGYLEPTSDGLALRDEGKEALCQLGIDFDRLTTTRRPLLRRCPDWSEGEVHLGGALAAGLFDLFLERGWLRRPHHSRLVQLTPNGRSSFRRHFGMTC
jgi:DNA-binding transcriptional ArsR family regulator